MKMKVKIMHYNNYLSALLFQSSCIWHLNQNQFEVAALGAPGAGVDEVVDLETIGLMLMLVW